MLIWINWDLITSPNVNIIRSDVHHELWAKTPEKKKNSEENSHLFLKYFS